MTKEELKTATADEIIDELNYTGCDGYYREYRAEICDEIKNRLERLKELEEMLNKDSKESEITQEYPVMTENEFGRVQLWALADRDELCADLVLKDENGFYDGSITASLQTNIPCTMRAEEAEKLTEYALEVFTGMLQEEIRKEDTSFSVKSFASACFKDVMERAEDQFCVLQLNEEEIER